MSEKEILQQLKKLNAKVERIVKAINKLPQRKWFTASELIAIIALIISGIFGVSSVYFAMQNQNLQNSLYNLQNSLYNFQPFIFSNYTTSTLNSLYCARNDTIADLYGLVTVDLKVITPYDGMLTINVKTLNFTERSWEFLDMNNLNFSEHSVSFLETTPHQYFISRDVINRIEDKLLVRLTVVLKPNWISPDVTAIGFNLGDLTFEASLFAVRTNQTMNKTFTENVYGMFTPI